MCKSLLDPKMDFVFRQIFGNEEYVDTLASFLNALFKGRPHIKSLELKNTEITKILEDNKTSRLDVRARTDTGIELDIEIQFKDTGEIQDRSLHYAANMFPQILKKNESYKKSRVIAIWILGDNVTNRKDAISEAYMTFQPSKSDGYEILSENERIFYIELPKFNPQNSDKRDLLNGWLEFIQEPSLMDSSWMENREISKAMERLKYLSADDKIRAIADLRQRDLNDRISERNAAKAEGREEERAKADAEKRESARKMLVDGLSIEMVSRYFGLSIEEINEIKKKIQ